MGAPGVPASITVNASFVPLPVGYDRALFVNVLDDFRDPVPGIEVTFTSADPAVVTVDPFGNLHAAGVGTAVVTIAAVGTSLTRDVTVAVEPDVPSGVAFQNHLEFGTPTDADPSDDILIVRDEYALSYNPNRGGANWVSWNLDASHIGGIDRCECYTPDPLLPPGVYRVVNFDYTGSGYSRGHMTQSFNRTVTLADNAATYLTTNILPQAAANNTGPWASFETYTNDRALAGEEVYIIAGGQYGSNPPTLKDEGKVAVPDYTWKVAVFMDRDKGLGDVSSLADIEVIAIRTPNRIEPGVPGSVVDEITTNDWRAYVVTVDEIEAAIGYDLLDLLPDHIEPLLESGFTALSALYHDAVASGDVAAGASAALGAQLRGAEQQLVRGRADTGRAAARDLPQAAGRVREQRQGHAGRRLRAARGGGAADPGAGGRVGTARAVEAAQHRLHRARLLQRRPPLPLPHGRQDRLLAAACGPDYSRGAHARPRRLDDDARPTHPRPRARRRGGGRPLRVRLARGGAAVARRDRGGVGLDRGVAGGRGAGGGSRRRGRARRRHAAHEGLRQGGPEWDVPMPVDAVFEIGSVTKQFTAAAVLRLRDEGKLDLDADITEYLPDYPTQGHRIPVRRLLDHTSGIKGYTEMASFGPISTRRLPRDSLVALFAAEPFDFPPGEAQIYNNSAYFLLGLIIEKVSGVSYEEYVERELFAKLGMARSSYCSNSDVVARRARGYQSMGGVLVRAPYLDHTWPYAAGSSVLDGRGPDHVATRAAWRRRAAGGIPTGR